MSDQSIHGKNLLQAVINAVPAPVFFKDDVGRYIGGNKAFEDYIGFTIDQLMGKTVHELFDQALADVYQAADDALMNEGGSQVYETKVKYADGSFRDVEFHKAVFHADLENVSGIVGVILDVTDRNLIQQQYQQLAFTDTLTGIDNRLSFQHDFESALSRAERKEYGLALILLDLDNFKQINDTYGHPAGDCYLIEAAKRLQTVVRKTDLVARLGGDEFAVVLEDIEDVSSVQLIVNDILQVLSRPVDCCGGMAISVSLGVAMYSDQVSSIDELMKRADAALYDAKKAGKNTAYWFNEPLSAGSWVDQSLI